MAFKMTPGIKGTPANSLMMNGGCGGAGQPPCPPRFQAEKMMAPVADRSSSARSKVTRAKKKVVAPSPAPAPVKLKVNLPKGFEMDKKTAQQFEMAFEDLSGYKNQEALDIAVMKFVKKYSGGGIGSPGEGPVIGFPGEGPVIRPPGKFEPEAGIGEESAEAVPVKGVAAKIAK